LDGIKSAASHGDELRESPRAGGAVGGSGTGLEFAAQQAGVSQFEQ